ncbi:hypothetical protein BG011_000672 [Mortierella polycephala]|uniref:Uncharacterized protein n=1 Tax=Mortierella polycephala TaxID=41804 RepID=A0A9P6TVP3_9FUNG|nr:hypothetical protein BG011_000672 [Mortierella polycephala]
MAAQYDKSRRHVAFEIGGLVYLDATNVAARLDSSRSKLRTKGKKLRSKYLGSLKATDRPSVLLKVHPVFHVSLLKPAINRDANQYPEATPHELYPLLIGDDSGQTFEGEWEMEKILKHRKHRGETKYLVK